MQRSISVDPTKMGVGRAIAVLTSGGDAQGEEVCICVYGPLWRPTNLTGSRALKSLGVHSFIISLS